MENLHHDCGKHGCYRSQLWDWTPFNDCFGNSGIKISDVDGLVERNGLFLMLDGKRVDLRGKRDAKSGQRRLYRRFAERGGHVLLFHGEPPRGVQWLREWRPGGVFIEERACDLAGLKLVVATWYQWANGIDWPEAELHAADPPVDDSGWPVDDSGWPVDDSGWPVDHPDRNKGVA